MNEKNYRETLLKRYDNEQENRKKLLDKRKAIDIKIQKSVNNLKKIKEEIEGFDIKCMVKVIKLMGYSLSYVQD
ncbi:hypothetical protein JYG23_00020 [Sedimentibacter sp. zth1]|uniref:hypothetical protein n=1 Tax=Sedimentibacter sp. zth1 TaxID=2816908 RepID=UPI001A912A46|nr:hypothetical protein [Sedimentibacter sp. zth1]QSX05896.1 hypothetical protein JYG23_00020 [Sedimentibacter sp. zth1]